MKFFVGWDDREQAAYQTCVHSLAKHSSIDLDISPLKHRALRKAGLFRREWRMDAAGQYWDVLDGKPFSTEFAFTRFLVPALAKDSGDRWAFFVDADFVFESDVGLLRWELDDSKAVMVVKHEHAPKNTTKMDGMQQTIYPRKNWSSLIAFNLRHPSNDRLTVETVNSATGSFLHRFGWLQDDEIGALSPGWNWLVGHSPWDVRLHAYHFTEGGPWLDDWDHRPCDEIWSHAHAESMGK